MKLSKFIEKAGDYVFFCISYTNDSIISVCYAKEFDIKRLKENDAKVVGFYPTGIRDHEYTRAIINVIIKYKKEKR